MTTCCTELAFNYLPTFNNTISLNINVTDIYGLRNHAKKKVQVDSTIFIGSLFCLCAVSTFVEFVN